MVLKHEEDDDLIEHPSKRTKRGKYTSKACGECQRRKIKCDGEIPCQACLVKGYDCERQGTDMRGRWRSSDRNVPIKNVPLIKPPETLAQSSDPIQLRPSPVRAGQSQAGKTPHIRTFSGESSITHDINVVEERLEQMGVKYVRLRSASPDHPFRSRLTPSPQSSKPQLGLQGLLTCQIFDTHQIVPDREQWDRLMQTYLEEVHILVPFLHTPKLWRLYEEMWQDFSGVQARDSETGGIHRVQIAQILLCLANGKSVESSRFEGDAGPYSAGWSLYSAARDMFGDLLGGFCQFTDQICVLQTVILMAIYLFRIDAHGSAEKVLALAISHAYHLGLQRNQVVEAMSAFEGEMSRRLWWCIYLLDRRLSIETGRPFLIQDVNVDVEFPRSVSEDWLTRVENTSPGMEISHVAQDLVPTLIPYLIGMASYSKVVGKVWEALYGATTSISTPSVALTEYLEHLISESQRGIRPELRYDPHHSEGLKTAGLAWWQVKQQFVMRIKWSSLCLLIRKPMLQRSVSANSPAPEVVQNEVICMRLAQRIIDDFGSVPEQHPKYTFPFLHYLTSATIIALGLVIRQPSFQSKYGLRTLQATRSLFEHCSKTWVSGKMTQTVWKLNQIADTILSPKERPVNRTTDGSIAFPSIPVKTDANEANYTRRPTPLAQSISPGSIATSTTAEDHSASQTRDKTIQYQFEPQINQASNSHPRVPSLRYDDMDFSYRSEQSFNTPGLHEVETPQFLTERVLDYTSSETASEPNYSHGIAPLNPSGSSWPRLRSPLPAQLEFDQTGEMIDGGMEWLQSIFANGLDADLPVWD